MSDPVEKGASVEKRATRFSCGTCLRIPSSRYSSAMNGGTMVPENWRRALQRRALQGCLVVAGIGLLAELLRIYAPGVARYWPPLFLVCLVGLSLGYALLVWRPQEVLRWLFPRNAMQLRLRGKGGRFAEVASAWIGVIVSAALLARWLWTLAKS